MSTPKIEPWITKSAMEQAREVWPGSAKLADNGSEPDIEDLRELSQRLAAIIARLAPAVLRKYDETKAPQALVRD